MDFYNKVIDTLLANCIEPWVTVYHWDMPQVRGQRAKGTKGNKGHRRQLPIWLANSLLDQVQCSCPVCGCLTVISSPAPIKPHPHPHPTHPNCPPAHPQALEDKYGGWLSDDVVPDFDNYARTLFELYGDRVKHWFTLNEPTSFCFNG